MWNTKMGKRAAQTLLLGVALLGGAAGASILVLPAPTATLSELREWRMGELRELVVPYSFSFAHLPTYEAHHQAMLNGLAALGFRRVWTRTGQSQGTDAFYSPDDDVTLICTHWSTPADASSPDTYSQAVYLVPGRVRRTEPLHEPL